MDGYAARPANRLLLMALASWVVLLVVALPTWLRSGETQTLRGGKSGEPVTREKETSNRYAPATFTSEEGGFSAEFPSKPRRTVATDTAADGTVVRVIGYSSVTDYSSSSRARDLLDITKSSSADNQGAVIVKYVDAQTPASEETMRKFLDFGPSIALERGTVHSRAFVSVGGNSAVDFVLKIPGNDKVQGRAIVTGNEKTVRLYILLAGPTSAQGSKAAWDRLIETFTLAD